MKVSLFSTYDINGGAAIATYRLHRALRGISVDSTMVVQRKFSDDPTVDGPRSTLGKIEGLIKPHVDSFPVRRYPNRGRELFSVGMMPDHLGKKVSELQPDLVHFFWMAGGFLRPETLLKMNRPIVWTLHDMWAFSGGCHYDDDCGRLRDSCGNCPLLGSKKERDLSRTVWKRKYEAYSKLPIVVVSTSKWLGEVARSSSIFRHKRIEIIPNNVDIERYKPINKQVAREAWNLPQDKKLVLFSAFSATADKRKGHQFLLPAIEQLAAKGLARDIELVIVGASEPPKGTPDIGLKTHYVGRLSDEISQVLLYSAADLLVAPSTQENLSNTVMESMSCGTPVVAFNIGGMPDMIDHMETGYLARAFDPHDLANGIQWILSKADAGGPLGSRARKAVVERYNAETVAQLNLRLYEDILKKDRDCL